MLKYSSERKGNTDITIQLDLQSPVQSVPINTEVVSSNPVHGELNSIQHYFIKFVSDLRQVGGLNTVNHQTKMCKTYNFRIMSEM
jgi:hypothetical protein